MKRKVTEVKILFRLGSLQRCYWAGEIASQTKGNFFVVSVYLVFTFGNCCHFCMRGGWKRSESGVIKHPPQQLVRKPHSRFHHHPWCPLPLTTDLESLSPSPLVMKPSPPHRCSGRSPAPPHLQSPCLAPPCCRPLLLLPRQYSAAASPASDSAGSCCCTPAFV